MKLSTENIPIVAIGVLNSFVVHLLPIKIFIVSSSSSCSRVDFSCSLTFAFFLDQPLFHISSIMAQTIRRLPRIKLARLWDSSSDNEDNDDLEIIAQYPATPSISTPISNSTNMSRLSLLPAFPSLHQHGVVVYRNREHLLLANIPRL